MDIWVSLAGFAVGVVVGLTGMGGGALMTPLLVLVFGVSPLSAVSSDLVASALMKPFGGAVHLRRGTVDRRLVGWLCVGSVPAAFAGVFAARAVGHGDAVQQVIQIALGVALLLAAAGLLIKAYLGLVEQARARPRGTGAGAGAASRDAVAEGTAHLDGTAPVADTAHVEGTSGTVPRVRVRVIPTILIGLVGGLIVGVTSVGSGSLIVIALLALYPTLRPNDLVGTDLVQAVPLVASAAVAHLLFGDFHLGLTAALLVGSIPGILLGATLSSRAPGGLIRRVLGVVLTASGLKLLGVDTTALGVTLLVLLVVGPLAWAWARTRHGLAPVAWIARRPSGRASAAPGHADPARNPLPSRE